MDSKKKTLTVHLKETPADSLFLHEQTFLNIKDLEVTEAGLGVQSGEDWYFFPNHNILAASLTSDS